MVMIFRNLFGTYKEVRQVAAFITTQVTKFKGRSLMRQYLQLKHIKWDLLYYL